MVVMLECNGVDSQTYVWCVCLSLLISSTCDRLTVSSLDLIRK
jgi:hypothetical protein